MVLMVTMVMEIVIRFLVLIRKCTGTNNQLEIRGHPYIT